MKICFQALFREVSTTSAPLTSLKQNLFFRYCITLKVSISFRVNLYFQAKLKLSELKIGTDKDLNFFAITNTEKNIKALHWRIIAPCTLTHPTDKTPTQETDVSYWRSRHENVRIAARNKRNVSIMHAIKKLTFPAIIYRWINLDDLVVITERACNFWRSNQRASRVVVKTSAISCGKRRHLR
jgi:hypothetical protein